MSDKSLNSEQLVRRNFLKGAAGALGGAAFAGKLSAETLGPAADPSPAEEQAARATRGLPTPIIKDIKVITTQPAGARLVVVKIITDQDGLYGYGCATFTQRADLVTPA
ncbi:MAG: twin-arginine translocation signal domain-containing protein, partial [Terriglobia bacterium]